MAFSMLILGNEEVGSNCDMLPNPPSGFNLSFK